MHSSRWVLDTKAHLSCRLDHFCLVFFKKTIFEVLNIFLFGTTHNKIKGVFSHFHVKTLVGLWLIGGEQDHLLNSDGFWFTDAAQSEAPLNFTVRLPPVL